MENEKKSWEEETITISRAEFAEIMAKTIVGCTEDLPEGGAVVALSFAAFGASLMGNLFDTDDKLEVE